MRADSVLLGAQVNASQANAVAVRVALPRTKVPASTCTVVCHCSGVVGQPTAEWNGTSQPDALRCVSVPCNDDLRTGRQRAAAAQRAADGDHPAVYAPSPVQAERDGDRVHLHNAEADEAAGIVSSGGEL